MIKIYHTNLDQSSEYFPKIFISINNLCLYFAAHFDDDQLQDNFFSRFDTFLSERKL